MLQTKTKTTHFLSWSILVKRLGFSVNKNIGLNEDREVDKGSELDLKNVRNLIQSDSIFNINGQAFNIENNNKENISTFDCFYSPATESLCVIIEEKNKYSELKKEVVMNLIEFSRKVNANSLLFLVDKKNKDYAKIMQTMFMVGFQGDSKYKTAKLFYKEYKLIRMDFKTQRDTFEEVVF